MSNIRIVSIILFIKLSVLFLFSSAYSVELFLPFVNIFIEGNLNPWQYYYNNTLDLNSFPYHGLMLYILSIPFIFIELFDINNQQFIIFIFKTPLFLADIAIFYILSDIYSRKKNKVVFYYLMNPVIFYAIYIHSQLDIIPISLLLLSLYFLIKSRILYFSLALGLALSTKLNILISLPLFFFYLLKNHSLKKAIIYILPPVLILLIFDFPFLLSNGFLEMVLFNSKQSLIFDSYYKIGNLELLFPVSAILMVYLHFFNQNKRTRLIEICKNNLKQNGMLIIFSLNTLNNEIPCFKLMKQKLNRGLERDSRMIKSTCKILKDNKIDKFVFKVSITKNKYIQMLKQRYISCLVNLNKDQISKGIKEIKDTHPNKMIFDDVLICLKYKN